MVSSAGGAVVGMVVGAVLLIMLADVAPRVVNGLLLLILAGLVLKNSSRYTSLLAKYTSSSKK